MNSLRQWASFLHRMACFVKLYLQNFVNCQFVLILQICASLCSTLKFSKPHIHQNFRFYLPHPITMDTTFHKSSIVFTFLYESRNMNEEPRINPKICQSSFNFTSLQKIRSHTQLYIKKVKGVLAAPLSRGFCKIFENFFFPLDGFS